MLGGFILRNLVILLGICLFGFLFGSSGVYASDAYGVFSAARSATFEGNVVHLSGGGSVNEKKYQLAAQMRGYDECRFRLQMGSELISLILTDGKIYDEDRQEQKVAGLFAKLVSLGVLDPFFLIEILDGQRDELYRPYMSLGPDGVVQLALSPKESLALYEAWTSDLRGLLGAAADGMSQRELSLAETFLRQILTSLEADVQYNFHIENGLITKINIQSKTAAPEPRNCKAEILIK